MTTETNRSRTRPASGAASPSDATADAGTAARRNPIPPMPLPLPGLPFGIEPKRLLWYGGLAALATVGVLEWPVAAVVGVGSYVTERMAREDALRAGRQHS
jgi:hypothetical protein